MSITSIAILCETREEMQEVFLHFFNQEYKFNGTGDSTLPPPYSLFVIPSAKSFLIRDKQTAIDNAKEGYPVIEYSTFKTIVG
jgi:hypothetical protein